MDSSNQRCNEFNDSALVIPCLGTICHHVSGPDKFGTGAARGTRTPDPVITNDVLYQLSYCGGPSKSRPNEAETRGHLISGTAPIGKEKQPIKDRP